MNAHADVPTIERSQLTRVARHAAGRPRLEVDTWQVEPMLGGIAPTSGGLYRVAGTGRDPDDQPVAWSAILKRVSRTDAWTVDGSDPARTWGFWQREPLAYESGLLDDLPGGLAAPGCYEVAEGPDGAWLWLEEIVDEHGPRWPLARYGLAARHLGAFNGAFLAGRPIPDRPWLSAGGLRAWCAVFLPHTALLATIEDHPTLRRHWPGNLAERTRRLFAEHVAFLDALDRLPQTFCHGDASRPNLFARHLNGRDQTVAVDWAFLGRAAVGQEVANLIMASALFFRVDVADFDALEAIALEGYLAGLREAGWRGEERQVRLGYLIDAALRNGVLPYCLFEPDERWRSLIARATHGHSFEELDERYVELRRFMVDRADMARSLLTGSV